MDQIGVYQIISVKGKDRCELFILCTLRVEGGESINFVADHMNAVKVTEHE
jgi:hypothetical protein